MACSCPLSMRNHAELQKRVEDDRFSHPRPACLGQISLTLCRRCGRSPSMRETVDARSAGNGAPSETLDAQRRQLHTLDRHRSMTPVSRRHKARRSNNCIFVSTWSLDHDRSCDSPYTGVSSPRIAKFLLDGSSPFWYSFVCKCRVLYLPSLVVEAGI